MKLSLSCVAVCVLGLVRPTVAQQMVAPETLPQGFIIVVEDKAKLASAPSPIYMASNLNGWNPGDAQYKLAGRSDMRWQIQIAGPLSVEKLEFKFARGSWDLEELDAKLEKIGNRTLPKVDVSKLKPGELPIIELQVERWGDETEAFKIKNAKNAFRELDVTGTVKRLQVIGGGAMAGGGGMMRDVLVWLPPGYEKSTQSYPVLYLHDGQNVFEQLSGVPGEWKADETATRMITAGEIDPIIIVAIPHAGEGRIREYMPNIDGLGELGKKAGGDAYVKWLTGEVMPRVERSFRVKTDPAHTFIGGASLGATISLHAIKMNPGRFGGVILESLPLKLGDERVWESYIASVQQWPARVYIGMGSQELGPEADKAARNAGYVDAARALAKRLEERKPGAPVMTRIEIGEGDVHNEVAWGRRLPFALEAMLLPRTR